jgi:hypothetical protein
MRDPHRSVASRLGGLRVAGLLLALLAGSGCVSLDGDACALIADPYSTGPTTPRPRGEGGRRVAIFRRDPSGEARTSRLGGLRVAGLLLALLAGSGCVSLDGDACADPATPGRAPSAGGGPTGSCRRNCAGRRRGC